MSKLTVEAVDALMDYCMLNTEEIDEDLVFEVPGIVHRFGFAQPRIEEKEQEIKELLYELPIEFRSDSESGGSSFVRMPMRADGSQWGEQVDAEALLCLGQASGWAWMAPPELWEFMYGNVPYAIVRTERASWPLATPEQLETIRAQMREHMLGHEVEDAIDEALEHE